MWYISPYSRSYTYQLKVMGHKKPKALFKALDSIGQVKKLKSEHTLVPFGKVAKKVYVVQKGGLVLLHVHPKTGEERAVNFFIPEFHPIATVSESFMFEISSKYHLKTFTNSVVTEINKETVEAFIKTDQGQAFQDYGMKSLLDKNELKTMLVSLSSEEMLQYLNEEYPEILEYVPSKYVANFLGITSQSLSKLMHSI